MRGVVFTGNRNLEFMEFDDPTPGPRDVVLEIKASGMCGSDLHKYRAAPGASSGSGFSRGEGPVIAGHEPCGIVAAVGTAVTEQEAQIGQRVMNHHYSGCGTCKHCSSGWAQMCLEGTTVYGSGAGHGAHAKYMKVPVSTLVPLPDDLSYEVGAAISCGTGTAFGALNRLDLRGDETIAIFGQGPVGLSATQLAVAMGARVIALDLSPERRAMAEQFGAHEVLDPLGNDPVSAIRELTHGEGAHKTLDCSSSPEARAAAVRATRTWGTACYVGEGGEVTLEVSPDMLRRQITLVASWTFSKMGQADCAEFVSDRKIPVENLFTDRWKLDQAEEAYKLFDTQTTGKGVFLM